MSMIFSDDASDFCGSCYWTYGKILRHLKAMFSFLTQFYGFSKTISPICMDRPKLYYRELRQCNFVPSYRA